MFSGIKNLQLRQNYWNGFSTSVGIEGRKKVVGKVSGARSFGFNRFQLGKTISAGINSNNHMLCVALKKSQKCHYHKLVMVCSRVHMCNNWCIFWLSETTKTPLGFVLYTQGIYFGQMLFREFTNEIETDKDTFETITISFLLLKRFEVIIVDNLVWRLLSSKQLCGKLKQIKYYVKGTFVSN